MSPPSEVWVYFTKVGKKVRCSKCQVEMNYCNSTSSLQKHLEKIHNIEICSNKRKRTLTPTPVPVSASNKNNEQAVASTSHGVINSTNVDSKKPKTHGTMEACMDKVASFAHGGQRHADIADTLLYMIAVDCLPLSVTERKGFKEFVKALQPLYHPPGNTTVTTMMEQKYKVLQAKMQTFLSTKKNLVLTTDIWTESMTTKSYLGLTAHYLDGMLVLCLVINNVVVNFAGIEMKSVIIGAKPMPQRKTIENLSILISGLCLEWGINLENIKAVVSDNGANIVGACRNVFGASKHIACLAHNLNIVVTNPLGLYKSSKEDYELQPLPDNQDSDNDELHDDEVDEANIPIPELLSFKDTIRKIKRIVGFFRRSERATEELKALQIKEWKELESECLKLIQEVRTRWNSLYEMLDRFLNLCKFVGRVLAKVSRERSSKERPPIMITSEEEEIAREIRDLLKPLWQVSTEICAEKSVTLSKCIPLVDLLRKSIHAYVTTHPVTFNMKTALLAEIEKRFGGLEKSKMHAMATIFDPRFKKLYFHYPRDAANAVKAILDEIKVKKSANAEFEEREAPPVPANNDDIWSYQDMVVAEQLPDADDRQNIGDIDH